MALIPGLTICLAALAAQIGPIHSVDPQATSSLREMGGRGIFPEDVAGRVNPDGAFVEGTGAKMPPFRLVGRRSEAQLTVHTSEIPPNMTTPITLAIQNFAEMAVRVVIFRFGSAESVDDVQLERGDERLFSARKLPRGTYFVVVAAADASARLARLDLPWSDRSDRPSSTPGGLFELIVVPPKLP